jgi:hypothetical protein
LEEGEGVGDILEDLLGVSVGNAGGLQKERRLRH